jgi:hypothetical protein
MSGPKAGPDKTISQTRDLASDRIAIAGCAYLHYENSVRFR